MPRSEIPQATLITHGGRRQRREQQRKARRRLQRRRLLVALPVLIGVLTGLLFFALSIEREPVARLEVPTVGSGPKVLTTGLQTGLNPDPLAGSEAATGATRVETELTEEKAEPLRSELGQIARVYPATYGVVVLDPSSGERVAMDADRRFLAASLNKLPVLMTLYKAAASGEVDLDDEISMQASDVQAYGTGVLYTYPVGHTMTLRECARLLIKESDNTAWKMLDRYLGRDYIRAELYRVGARSTEYWIPNTTTPNDVLLMLEKISDPSYTTPDLSAEMLDVMANTAFEDRLPQPLPEGTRVSHKIGYYGTTFADAGVVFPEGARDARDAYLMVVIASDTSELASRAATQEMSLVTYHILSEPAQTSTKDAPDSKEQGS
ncbi:MAG: serine hydrolase [Rubrobacteraceae bacterium]|nr:serine hydrolase [Rubrobacteraceae bacterium]MBA3702655.1 serine hydrolase [Rubrobacteraceae bacterium]